jgi:hypothetical protein
MNFPHILTYVGLFLVLIVIGGAGRMLRLSLSDEKSVEGNTKREA